MTYSLAHTVAWGLFCTLRLCLVYKSVAGPPAVHDITPWWPLRKPLLWDTLQGDQQFKTRSRRTLPAMWECTHVYVMQHEWNGKTKCEKRVSCATQNRVFRGGFLAPPLVHYLNSCNIACNFPLNVSWRYIIFIRAQQFWRNIWLRLFASDIVKCFGILVEMIIFTSLFSFSAKTYENDYDVIFVGINHRHKYYIRSVRYDVYARTYLHDNI